MKPTKCARTGFTLIELLVVIAIIAVLAAILFPVFAQAQKGARTTKCESNLRQITQAFQRYTDDNNGGHPPYEQPVVINSVVNGNTILPWPGTEWKTGILSRYLRSEMIAACPENTPLADANAASTGSGLWNYNKGIGVYGYNAWYLAWGGAAPSSLPAGMTNSMMYTCVKSSNVRSASKTICFIDALDEWATPPTGGSISGKKGPRGFDCVAAGARHNNGWNAAFCDGHVRYYKSAAADKKSVLYYDKPNGRSVIAANDDLWDLK